MASIGKDDVGGGKQHHVREFPVTYDTQKMIEITLLKTALV